jgi:hypothetical protein
MQTSKRNNSTHRWSEDYFYRVVTEFSFQLTAHSWQKGQIPWQRLSKIYGKNTLKICMLAPTPHAHWIMARGTLHHQKASINVCRVFCMLHLSAYEVIPVTQYFILYFFYNITVGESPAVWNFYINISNQMRSQSLKEYNQVWNFILYCKPII